MRTWVPRAVALGFFAFYALLVPPGPFWLDASELGAAAVRMGSPHPSGYPLFCVLGKLASLVPVGELAFRIHLLSAACGALALLWICRLVHSIARPCGEMPALVGGVAAAALIGLSLTFARHATATEVYAPTAALLALTFLLFDRVARGKGARTGLLLVLVAGLGLGLHGSYRVLVPLPLAALLWVRLKHGARWPLLAPVMVLAVGGALYLYLPVRSATGRTAAVDWGHPRHAGALLDHFTARSIRETFADDIFSTEPLVVDESARKVLGGAVDQLGVLGLLAALGGAVWLGRERRSHWTLVALGLCALGDVAFAIWIEPMGIDELQTGVPLALAVGALAGVGVAWLGRFAGRRAGPWVAGAAGTMLVVGPAMLSWPALAPGGRGDLPRRYAEAALDATPPRGIVLTESDSLSASLLFLTAAEQERPDVAALVRQRLGDLERTRALAGGPVDPAHPLAGLLGRGRPVTWQLGTDATPRGYQVVAGPVVSRLHRGSPEANADIPAARADQDDVVRAAAALDRLFETPDADDPIARRTLAHNLTSLGRLAYRRGAIELAGRLFDAALAVKADQAEAWVDRGVVLSRQGQLERAARATERALAIEPNRPRALVNAARYRLALGQDDRALRHAERAMKVAPTNASAWTLAGIADARAGRTDRARARLERALALDPHQDDARRALSALH